MESYTYILGDCYAIEKAREANLLLGAVATDSGRNYEKEIDALADDLRSLEKRISENIFVFEEDKQRVAEYVREIYKNIALTRQDTLKLYD